MLVAGVQHADQKGKQDKVVRLFFMNSRLNQTMQSNLKKMGINSLTPMQSRIYEMIRSNHHTLLSAPTGTGKTLSYLMPLIDKVLEEKIKFPENQISPQILILTPGPVLNNQTLHCLIRASIGLCLKSFLYPWPIGIPQRNFYNPHFLISSVGSVIQRNKSQSALSKFLVNTSTIVLDEADYLISQSQTRRLLKSSKTIQKVFVGATLRDETLDIIKDLVPDLDIYDGVSELRPIPKNIEEILINLPISDSLDKKNVLLEKSLILTSTVLNLGGKHLVFTNTVDSGQTLFMELKKPNLDLELFLFNGTGDITQRLDTLSRFRSSLKSSVLISTDLLARGIDFNGMEIKSVWNFNSPKKYTDYIHRVGRTGRMGVLGKAFNFSEN